MSYAESIDETEEDALRNELKRREAARASGTCDYCGREPETPPCKFPKRHDDARICVQRYRPRTR